jgi:hypothetical protein
VRPEAAAIIRQSGLATRRNHASASTVVEHSALEDIMAQPAWKRPGSPIGKKGPRKSNPKYKQRSGEPWTTDELKNLKALAKQNMPTGVLSLKLRRPPAAIRSKAQREGISLRPTNRSPYSRRKP